MVVNKYAKYLGQPAQQPPPQEEPADGTAPMRAPVPTANKYAKYVQPKQPVPPAPPPPPPGPPKSVARNPDGSFPAGVPAPPPGKMWSYAPGGATLVDAVHDPLHMVKPEARYDAAVANAPRPATWPQFGANPPKPLPGMTWEEDNANNQYVSRRDSGVAMSPIELGQMRSEQAAKKAADLAADPIADPGMDIYGTYLPANAADPNRNPVVRFTGSAVNTVPTTINSFLELSDAAAGPGMGTDYFGNPLEFANSKTVQELRDRGDPSAELPERWKAAQASNAPTPTPTRYLPQIAPLDAPQNLFEMGVDFGGEMAALGGPAFMLSNAPKALGLSNLATRIGASGTPLAKTAGYATRTGSNVLADGVLPATLLGMGLSDPGKAGETVQAFVTDPLTWSLPIVASALYRANIYVKSQGATATPQAIKMQQAMDDLSRMLNDPMHVPRPESLRLVQDAALKQAGAEAGSAVPQQVPYPRPDIDAALARPAVAPTPEQAASATPPYPRPDMDPVQPETAQPATATAPPAPVQPVGPPKAFSASPEPRGPGAWRRSAVGGFTGAFLGGVGDSFAASGGDGGGPDIINPINGGIAGMLVPRFAGQAWRAGRRASMRSPAARNAYDRKIAYDVLYKQFKAAGMPTAEAVVAAKEASYGGIEAAALLDMTQEGVNLASTLSRLPGTTPGRLAPRADELVENRPERLETYIGQVTELPTSAVRGNIEKLAEEAREAAKPAYEALRKDYPLGSINSQRLEQIEGLAPHIKAVDEYRLYVAANEGRVVGDFEYWDLVKRHMDSEEQQLLGRPGMTLDDIRVRKLESARAALVEEMDRLVPGYEAARELGGVAPKIKEAAAEGETYIGGRYLGDEVEEMISKWSGVPLTAAQSAAIRTIISKAKSGGAAVASLSSAKAREQLAGVFGKDKADDLQAFFAADAAIVRNASRTNPNVNSATSQVMLGAGEGLLPAAAETIRAARNPVEAVLARMAASGAYSQAQRDFMGEMLAKGVTLENLAPIFAGRRPRGGGRPRGGAGPTTPQGPPTAGGAGPAAGAAAGPPPRAAAAATQQPRPAPSQEAVLSAMAQVTQPGPGKARGPMGPPARETIWDGPIPTKPQSLRAWIRSQGGIDDTNYMTGDVAAMMGGSNRMPGLINRKDGTGLDELTRKAFQEGFDVDPEDAGTLMRLIEEEFAGNPSYRIGAKDEWEAYQDTLRARRGEEPDQNSLGAFPGAGNAAAAASGVGGAAYGYYNPQDANEDGVIDDYDRQMTAMGMGFGGLVTAGLVRGAMGNRLKGPPGLQSNSFGGGSDKGPPAYNPRQEAANIRNSIGARAAPIIEKLPERAKGREMVEALAAEGVSMYKNEQKAFFRRFPQDKPATRKQVAAFMDDVASGKTFDGQLPAGRPVPPSIDEVTNLKAAQSLAAERPFGTNRELKVALDKRFRDRAKAARVDLSEDTKATREYIARVALADAIEAIRTNANAIGWYDDKVTKAMSVMEEVHPELATDVNARFAFTVALAITSNGQKVGKNFELAEQAYQVFKNTGRMPTNISAGEAQKAINESLDLFNELLNKHGMDKLRDIITTKRTVKEIENLTGVKIDERIDEEVFGAGIFGPKIGNGFLMNLHGEFGQLTIDRWFMRTWGRWTGNLIEKNKEMMDTKRGHLSGLIEMMDPSDKREFEAIIGRRLSVSSIDDVAHAIRKASQDPALRDRMRNIGGLGHNSRPMVDELLGPPPKGKERFSIGDELRKNGNGLWKYLDGQIEQPSGPPQRRQIREVLTTVLDALKKDYPDLTMADLQALLWYPEKRLYDGAKLADTVQVAEPSTGKGAKKGAKEGYVDDEAPDYLNAAIEHAEKLGISRDKIDGAIARGQTRIEARGRSGSLGSGNGRPAVAGAAKTQASANQVPVAPLQGPPTKAKPPLPGQTSQSSPVIGSALASGGLTAGATYAATGDEDLALRAGLGAGIVGGVVGSRLSKGSTPKPPKGPPKSAPVKMGFGGSQQVEERGQMFYSALSRAVEKSPPTKAPAGQWKATIANSPGVKAEEIEWTGVNDWLDMQTGPVTKQQVAEYLDGNGVKIEETVRGAPSGEALRKQEEIQRELLPRIEKLQRLNDEFDQIAETDKVRAAALWREIKALAAEAEALKQGLAATDVGTTTKWSSYTLPGGENYRELLLKTPVAKERAFDPSKVKFNKKQSSATQGGVQVSYDGKDLGTFDLFTRDASAPRGAFGQSVGDSRVRTDEEIIDIARQYYEQGNSHMGIKPLQEGTYKSSHWDEPNVLAHVRFNERKTSDGKRILAISEFQSDWHQTGRKRGYRTPEKDAAIKRAEDALEQARLNLRKEDARTLKIVTGYDTLSGALRDASYDRNALARFRNNDEEWVRAYDENKRLEAKAREERTGFDVPDAPFKNNAWASLSLKRMIRWAAENGFDEIAWNAGQYPVERFSLRHALGDVTARQMPDGRVSFTPGNGSRSARQTLQTFGEAGREGDTIMTREQAMAAFGENAGSRMFDQTIGVDQPKIFAGDDLNVGGEKMRNFYDRTLINEANSIGKKYGARVYTREIDTPAGRDGQATVKAGPKTFHSLPITPELKKRALGGQSLFGFGGQDATLAALGSVGGSFANQDDPQAGALDGMALALGGKYALRGASGKTGARNASGANEQGFGSGPRAQRKGPPKGPLMSPKAISELEAASKGLPRDVRSRLAENAARPLALRVSAAEAAGDDPSIYAMAAPFQRIRKPFAADYAGASSVERGINEGMARIDRQVGPPPPLDTAGETVRLSERQRRLAVGDATRKANSLNPYANEAAGIPDKPLPKGLANREKEATDLAIAAREMLARHRLTADEYEQAVAAANQRKAAIADALITGRMAPPARPGATATGVMPGSAGQPLPPRNMPPVSRREADDMAALIFDREQAKLLDDVLSGNVTPRNRSAHHAALLYTAGGTLAVAGATTTFALVDDYNRRNRKPAPVEKPNYTDPGDPRFVWDWEKLKSTRNDQMQNIQIQLNALPPNASGVRFNLKPDGKWSRGGPTDQAIQKWLYDNGFDPNGPLTMEHAELLDQQVLEARRATRTDLDRVR